MFHLLHTVYKIFIFFIIFVFYGLLTFQSFSHAEVNLDGTLGPQIALEGPDFQIKAEYGKIVNNYNLFHSFEKFNIDTGQSATFTGPDAIQNIIGRVTGGTLSNIDGMISVDCPVANLYLLNPTGFLFGPNASLNVNGSFHVTTADSISLGSEGIVYADPLKTSVLTIDPPTAFGFLGSNPAGISVQRSILEVSQGKTLSFVGGDITLENDPMSSTYFDYDYYIPGSTYYTFSAPEGKINLACVASPGEVNLNTADISSFTKLGNTTFSNGANLNVSSSDGMTSAGSVVIRGGQILFQDSSVDAMGNPAGSVDIKGESLQLDNGNLSLITQGDTNHPGSTFEADLSGDFIMKNESWIDASDWWGAGRGGDICISAKNITLGDDTPGAGYDSDYGFYGAIQSMSYESGRTGNIDIAADNITVKNGFYIVTAALYDGDAGDITVSADSIQMFDQGNIASNAFYIGQGGVVDVTARDIQISAANETAVVNSYQITGIGAQTSGSSNGGKIKVTADTLQIRDGGKISTLLISDISGYAEGRGADIEIKGNNISISGFVLDDSSLPPFVLSGVDARVIGAEATGIGGDITVTADNLSISNGGVIRTNLYDDVPGKAGNITVNGEAITINSGGQIYADSFRGTGDSGDLNITASSMNINGFGSLNASYPVPDFTGLSTTTNTGRGGTINLTLIGDLSVAERGGIKADTRGSGPGGAINISSQNVLLTKQGSIDSSSTGIGNAGNVCITAADSVIMRDGSITTEANDSDGGDISITAPYMVRLDGGRITASVGGGAETTGGNISIDPQYVLLKNSKIIANAFEGQGGNIEIASDVFLADPGSVIDASSSLGIDGQVDIRSPISQVNGLISPLSKDFRSVVALLRKPCMARVHKGDYSSFIIKGRDSLPVEPERFLSSPLSIQ